MRSFMASAHFVQPLSPRRLRNAILKTLSRTFKEAKEVTGTLYSVTIRGSSRKLCHAFCRTGQVARRFEFPAIDQLGSTTDFDSVCSAPS